MSSILERNQKLKPKKKSMQDHAEDALYREVWEEVHTQKAYDFIRKYYKWLIAAALVILILVVGWQIIRHNRHVSARRGAENYESAMVMAQTGKFDLAAESFARNAKSASGGMADLSLFQSAKIDLASGKTESGVAKLQQLADRGETRDFRDLAIVYLAAERGDAMTAGDFEKFLSPLQTKRSPFYYTGFLMIAQKYIATGDSATAQKWLDKIINDQDAPSTIVGIAETLR